MFVLTITGILMLYSALKSSTNRPNRSFEPGVVYVDIRMYQKYALKTVFVFITRVIVLIWKLEF